MKRLEEVLTRTLEGCLAVALLAIAVVIVLQVVLSFGFNSSITGANELVTKLFVYTSTVGAALAIGKNEHIQITIARDQLPQSLQVFVAKLAVVLVGLLNLVMFLYSFHWIRVTGAYLMPTTQLPRYVVQISVPLGCGLAMIYCGLRLVAPGQAETSDSPPPP